MAKADESETPSDASEAVVPSELDERTHAEMILLYGESAAATRFAKHQQWATVGGTLMLFVLLGYIGRYAAREGLLFNLAIVCSILLSLGCIYSLVIYQSWQNAEREKLAYVAARLSSLTRAVRDIAPPREGNIYRYILLSFMILLIALANFVLIIYLTPR